MDVPKGAREVIFENIHELLLRNRLDPPRPAIPLPTVHEHRQGIQTGPMPFLSVIPSGTRKRIGTKFQVQEYSEWASERLTAVVASQPTVTNSR